MKKEFADAWKQAKSINDLWEIAIAAGLNYMEVHKRLTLCDSQMLAYGDLYLYQDTETGDYYEEYFSIGD